jgi:hypothetical protein
MNLAEYTTGSEGVNVVNIEFTWAESAGHRRTRAIVQL